MMILASGYFSRMAWAVSRPSIPGMMMSIVTRSGRTWPYVLMESSPLRQ